MISAGPHKKLPSPADHNLSWRPLSNSDGVAILPYTTIIPTLHISQRPKPPLPSFMSKPLFFFLFQLIFISKPFFFFLFQLIFSPFYFIYSFVSFTCFCRPPLHKNHNTFVLSSHVFCSKKLLLFLKIKESN